MIAGHGLEMRVQCKAPTDFGHHFVPLAFYFGWKDSGGKVVSVGDHQGPVTRFVAVHVLGDTIFSLYAKVLPL